MKSILLILFFFSTLHVFSQDTLFFPSGEIRAVEIISIDKLAGLIHYKINGKNEVRSISSLKSYTNHSNNFQTKFIIQSDNEEKEKMIEEISLSEYDYGKFSIGINLLSPLSALHIPSQMFIATNYNQHFFCQYIFTNKIGIRLPIRLGLNQITKPKIKSNAEIYKSIAFETGFEPIFFQNDDANTCFYISPGFYLGQVENIRTIYNDTNSIYNISYLGPKRGYIRLAINSGIQINLNKIIQLNFEGGINYNNIYTWYYKPYAVASRFTFQGAINLVYRFNGAKRE